MATQKKRINISIDQNIYQRLKAKCFIENKSISGFIAESVLLNLSKDKSSMLEEVLNATEEEELLAILNNPENKERMTHNELKNKFNLK
jgi:predicted CopG family antitoxin